MAVGELSAGRVRCWRGFAFWAAFGITAAAIFSIGATDPWVAAVMAILLLVCLVVVCVGCCASKVSLTWHPLLWPVLGFGLLVVAQIALGHTVASAASLTGLAALAGPAAVFYLGLFAFRSPALLERLARAAWWVTLIISIEAILQKYLAGGFIYWIRDATYATPAGPYVYHNHFAGCMDLLLPLAAAGVFLPLRSGASGSNKRLILAISPALGFVAVLTSQSRGGMLCVLGEAALALVIFGRAGKIRWRGALAGAVAMVALVFIANWGPIWRRFLTLQHGDISALDRVHLAQSCFAIWHAFPFWGSGFNTFASIYPQYQVVDFGTVVRYAHNEYAQALAELGVLGAAIVVAFLVIGWLSYRRYVGHGTTALVRRAAVIAVLGFLAHSAIDFQFHSPANAALFFMVAGAVTAATARTDRRAGVVQQGSRRRRAHRVVRGLPL